MLAENNERIYLQPISVARLLMSSALPTVQPADPCEPLCAVAVAVKSPPSRKVANAGTAEIANSITHGLGLALSLVAVAVLMIAARHCDFWQLLACGIYAATMVSVYAASTLSHIIQQPRLQHFFRMVDQGCIYLFIVGTFTPIAAAYLREGNWWILLSAMWTIALAGFFSKVVLVHRIDGASVAIPVLLGWMPLLGGRPMLELVPAVVVWWVVAGGVCYTVGTLFLMFDHRHRYLHAVWHLFVIAGSACHFWAILRYVVPAA